MIQSRIHMRVQAVVSVLDDFTGRAVENSLIRLEMPEGTRVIPKAGGCFVIIDSPSRQMNFHISSPIYETAHIDIDLDACEEACPMIGVRLIPGHCYPIQEGITSIEGYTDPGESVIAVCTEQARPIRLQFDYEKKKDREHIRIYHMPGETLEGRQLALISQNRVLEYIEILKKEHEEGLYQLKNPLTKDYKKAGIYICRVNRGKTSENGYFRILLAQVPAEGCECICMTEMNTKTVLWSGRIQCGMRNITEEKGGN